MGIGLRWRLATYALPGVVVAPTVSGRYGVVREVYDGRRPSPQSSVHSQQPTGEFVRRQRAETEN